MKWPLVFGLSALALCAADEVPVSVEQGLLQGGAGRNAAIRVFKGIPYAQPPVGDLRWKAPKAPTPWPGVKSANQFGAACMQLPYPKGTPYYRDPEPLSEDCLYLNVWTGAKNARDRRPVMVWIHGGGLTRGSGAVDTYNGERLAEEGVVVVTVNYRLGVLGFYSHPELTKESDRNSSGNYGLLDQIAALEWVQKNIAKFGGDPKRVTIFGESAGARSVHALVASPLAKGLFQRAIAQSGTSYRGAPKLAVAEQDGMKLAQTLGAANLAALRAIPALELVAKVPQYAPPVAVDGWFLKDDVAVVMAKAQHNDVPVMTGFNADEGTALSPWMLVGSAERFRTTQKARFGSMADEFFKLYPASTEAEAKQSHNASFRDAVMGLGARMWMRQQARYAKAPAYYYYFTRVPAGPAGKLLGSFHAAEIAYVFGNLGPAADDTDRALSRQMMQYWLNFAKTGDPNGGPLKKWPRYDPASDEAMVFGDQVEPQRAVLKDNLDFMERAIQAGVSLR
jgi:para-nitrobenzyl esterase